MSRILTPSTVTLLLLIKLYCGGYVPPEGQLSVLTFITSRIVPLVTQNTARQPRSKANPIGHFALTLDDIKTLLVSYKSTLRNPSGSFTQEQNLWDFFATILRSINSLDKLLEETHRLAKLVTYTEDDLSVSEESFISDVSQRNVDDYTGPGFSLDRTALDGSYGRTALAKGSLFGIYVAQAQVEFEKLKFEDAMKVWRAYELYREPLMEGQFGDGAFKDTLIVEMNANSGGRMFEIINHSLNNEEFDIRQASSTDVEKMVEFQVNQMQKFGARVPKEMKLQLEATIGSTGSKSNLMYYASFLESWYQGDYSSSFEHLHRYYDYAMQHTDRSHYQYALLNMAILQADFGSFSEAAAAMRETIATARENKDMTCLNYCLSWLYSFETMNGGQSSKSVLRNVLQGAEGGGVGLLYLKAAAREHGMHSIESQVMLHEAGLCLSKGHRSLEAFERIYESSHLILHHELNSMRAAQVLALSSLYARLGVTSLATSLCNTIPDCFANITPQEQMIHARCRISYTLALVGKYETALEAIYKCQEDETRNIKCEQYLAQCVGIIKLKRALHHHDLLLAERLIATLKSTPSHDRDLAFIASLFEIDYLVRLENFSDAFELIESLFSASDGPANLDVYQRIRLMNAKAFLFARVGRPQKGFSITLRAATAAYRSKNALALWESVAALVGVLNGLNTWDAAVEVAESAIYQATETEDAAMIARLRSVGADALMGRAGAIKKDEPRRQENMREALIWVDTAFDLYKQLEDYHGQRDMALKGKAILKYLGDEEGVKERSDKYDQARAFRLS